MPSEDADPQNPGQAPSLQPHLPISEISDLFLMCSKTDQHDQRLTLAARGHAACDVEPGLTVHPADGHLSTLAEVKSCEGLSVAKRCLVNSFGNNIALDQKRGSCSLPTTVTLLRYDLSVIADSSWSMSEELRLRLEEEQGEDAGLGASGLERDHSPPNWKVIGKAL
ncbi:uncharacterized protein LOC142053738 [Phalacrocorax aristotelis]|uniref:uncharacterized protein LOC142053738 n=1 Tax=Phalacrocorax aristotelis TaxID=126867 RepID=UPI003F4C2692